MDRAESDEKGALSLCQQLLSHPNVGSILKIGDIYSLILRILKTISSLEAALAVYEQMKASLGEANLSFYIEKDMLDWLGVELTSKKHQRGLTGQSEISEYIEEDV
jgi:hypothetical protein